MTSLIFKLIVCCRYSCFDQVNKLFWLLFLFLCWKFQYLIISVWGYRWTLFVHNLLFHDLYFVLILFLINLPSHVKQGPIRLIIDQIGALDRLSRIEIEKGRAVSGQSWLKSVLKDHFRVVKIISTQSIVRIITRVMGDGVMAWIQSVILGCASSDNGSLIFQLGGELRMGCLLFTLRGGMLLRSIGSYLLGCVK